MARMAAPTLTPGSLTGTATINSGEPVTAQLKITQERIDISTLGSKPDPKWTFIDVAGHFHARSEDGELPTLIGRREHVGCDGSCDLDDCEGYDVTHWHCRICDEEIQPGVIPGPHYGTMPGRIDWEVAVQTVINGHGEVSVVYRSERVEYFGVAIPGDVRIETGFDGSARGRTVLHGVSPLGRRTVVPTA